jgi:hypothetical protein
VATTRHDQGTDIDGISFAVFAKFGIGNAIATAALVRTIGIDAAQCVPKFSGMIGSLVADPGGKGFRHCTAQDSGRIDRDTPAVGQQYGIEPDHIATAALAWTDEPGQQLDRSDCRQSLIAIAQCAGDIRGIESAARGFGKGMRLRPKRWPRSR